MAIELIFRDENGKNIEQTLIVDAEFIIRDDYLKEYLKDYFLQENDECVCSLSESQSHCECGGILNENLDLAEINDI